MAGPVGTPGMELLGRMSRRGLPGRGKLAGPAGALEVSQALFQVGLARPARSLMHPPDVSPGSPARPKAAGLPGAADAAPVDLSGLPVEGAPPTPSPGSPPGLPLAVSRPPQRGAPQIRNSAGQPEQDKLSPQKVPRRALPAYQADPCERPPGACKNLHVPAQDALMPTFRPVQSSITTSTPPGCWLSPASVAGAAPRIPRR